MSFKLQARRAIAESKGQRFDVGDDVRAARGVAIQLFDLRRAKADADRRVDAAAERLAKIDVSALQVELADALAEQAEIDAKLAELQGGNVLMAG
ncbi:hypothetical protein [Bradyrhizobium sp.]|uniref:hypothetical protein n=1 Tax=Bradyrhizobium sp. TaxID=376 RepID=UPI000AC0653B|nr:hypothetical protein [Bradyrhizobium sp.]